MADCRICKHNYKMPGDEPRCNRMCDGESDFEAITKADKIRSMSDEELAEFFEKYGNCDLCPLNIEECLAGKGCKNGFLQYLQSEAE